MTRTNREMVPKFFFIYIIKFCQDEHWPQKQTKAATYGATGRLHYAIALRAAPAGDESILSLDDGDQEILHGRHKCWHQLSVSLASSITRCCDAKLWSWILSPLPCSQVMIHVSNLLSSMPCSLLIGPSHAVKIFTLKYKADTVQSPDAYKS